MSSLDSIFASLGTAPVTVIGDLMLDRYVNGEASRISPEAPIPVLRVTGEREMLGGAGNVVANLATLGVPVRLVALVGEDEAGATIRRLLAARGVDAADLVTTPGRATTLKTRYIAGGQQLLRADCEDTGELPAALVEELVARVRAAVRGARAVVLSDYGKGVLAPHVIEAALEARVPVIVDPKGRDWKKYRGASLVTPNRKELAEASGMPTGNDLQIEQAALEVLTRCGIGGMVATRSAEGMSIVEPGRPVRHMPTLAREVFDVSGAGDTVVAALAAALAAGSDLDAAADLANLAAGVVVGKLGTATATREEIRDAEHRRHHGRTDAKLASLGEALARVSAWRQSGLRIGFTNGCFDLLHPGHVSLLQQARAACDRLVVGLNSDESVRRLKGPTRPVQDELARATVLASLADVDLVVLFADDTPMALIEAIRPEVLVKGADYTVATVVGSDLVQSYGGRILLADLTPGQSTTSTIRRMAAAG